MSEKNQFDESLIIHTSEKIVVFFAPQAVTVGHTIVMSRERFSILEEVPDDVLSEIAIISNKISGLLFEKLGAQGTNILIQNGPVAGQSTPSFSLHIIPRKESDDFNFEWKNTSPSQSELNRAADQLLGQGINATALPSAKQITINKSSEEEIDDDSLLAKQLERTP